MKTKFISVIIPLLFSINLMAQAVPTIDWKKCFGGLGNQAFYDIRQTPDGGYIATGSFEPQHFDSIPFLSTQVWVVKFDEASNIEWENTYGGSGYESGIAIEFTSDGGYLIAGSTTTVGGATGFHGSYDYWIMKLNGEGDLQWEKALGGSSAEVPVDIISTSDGNFLIAGKTSSIDGDVNGFHIPYYYGDDYWVIKINPAGDILWSKCYGGYVYDIPGSVIETTDGNYVIAGYTNSVDGDVTVQHGSYDAWIIKIQPDGDLIWQKSFGSGPEDYAYSIIEDENNDLVFAGHSRSNYTGYHGGFDYWMVKLNKNGKLKWSNVFGGSKQDYGTEIAVLQDGSYVIGGWSHSLDGDVVGSHKHVDYWIAGVNVEGNLLWTDALGGKNGDYMYCIAPTSDNGFIISGSSYSNNGNVTDNFTNTGEAWTVKMNYSGEELKQTPNPAKSLFSLYPNPFTQVLNITCNQTVTYPVMIQIRNVTGQVIQEEIIYSDFASIRTEILIPGIYFVEIQYGSEKIVQKVVKE